MAFNIDNLNPIGGAAAGLNNVWYYTTADANAALDTASYFDGAADVLKVGDLILCNAGDNTTFAMVVVNANDGTTVDTSDVFNTATYADAD